MHHSTAHRQRKMTDPTGWQVVGIQVGMGDHRTSCWDDQLVYVAVDCHEASRTARGGLSKLGDQVAVGAELADQRVWEESGGVGAFVRGAEGDEGVH